MPKPICFRLLPGLIAGVVLLAPAQAQVQQGGRIVGLVRVSKGDFPPRPVLVSLEFRGSTIATAFVDSSGRFGFYDLGANPYRIQINDDEYDPVDEPANVNPLISPTTFVQVELFPRKSKKQDPLPDRVTGNNPYLVNPAEYNQKFPKKAVKEFERGVDADRHGDSQEAIRHYQKALVLAPDYYPALNNLGSDYLSRSEFQQAEAEFRKGIELNASDAQAYFNLGNVMLLTQRYSEAEHPIEEGLQRRPDSAFGHFLQGSLYSHTGHPELAEKSLQSALQLDPTMSQVYLQLVNLYLQQKRTSDAINELEAYLRAFPDTPFSPKARSLLKRLQGSASASPQ